MAEATRALLWDVDGTRTLESGVSKCVLFPMYNKKIGDQDYDASKVGTYDHGVAWQGITAINENPGGADLTDLYADNIKYASLRAAETFACTIEAYTFPDEWMECDGSGIVSNGVFIGQQPRRAFGLCYRTEIGDDAHPGMDAGYKLHFVYNCTASPSGRGYTTINNSPDAISFSWEASSTPTNVTGYKPTSTIVVDSTKIPAAKQVNLEALLAYVYGVGTVINGVHSVTTEAEMPTPDEVINFIANGTKS